MTIKQREHIQNFSQQKKVMILNEKNGNLSEATEQELFRMSDVRQQKLWKTLWHAATHHQHVDKNGQCVKQSVEERKMEDKGILSCGTRQLNKKKVNEEMTTDGGSDHLLILAHSAELMSESEDSFDRLHMDGQDHEDLKSLGEPIDGFTANDHVRCEEGRFQCEGKTPRLTQIRCQARSKSSTLVEQIGECTGVHLQGRRTRLTQIRHQARSKNHSQLQERIEKYSSGNLPGKVIRLSQLRRQARSKRNSLVQAAIEEHVHGHFVGQALEESQRDRTIAEIFGEDAQCKLNVANGGPQDKILVKGRMRLSKLRREARLVNAGVLDR